MKRHFKKTALIVLGILLTVRCAGFSVPVKTWAEDITKRVYLTFDDGPSPYNTNRIIDILNENHVKATFCVVGTNAQAYPNVIQRIHDNQMGLIPHCNNHDYAAVYNSTEGYVGDFRQCAETLNNILSENNDYNMVRMPGGSTNTVCDPEVLSNIKNYLQNNNIHYIDWSVDSGDAEGYSVNPEKIKENVYRDCGTYRIEVVLMHDLDSKYTTAEALNDIIYRYKEMGYEFKILPEMRSWEYQYLKNIGVMDRN